MNPFYCVFLLFISFGCASFAQVDTTYYSVVSKNKIIGGQKTWTDKANEYRFEYKFNDRGRGDSTRSIICTNAEGLLVSLGAKGVDYYKNPYTETFSIVGDTAVWTVNGDRKAKKFNGELYTTNVAPAVFELLLRWIIKQPGKKAAILPDGFMHMGDPVSKTISFKGKTQKLKLIPVYFDPAPAPVYVWMTDDLKFFATINTWSSNIRRGYESWTDTLFAIEESASLSYYERELNNYSKSLPHRMLFTHCTVFQSATASVQKDMYVEVTDGKVTAVSQHTGKIASKPDTIIDCKDKFLMPGLWDMHGHYAKDEGPAYLAGGVTHIRDMGNDKVLLTYKKQIAENQLLGPDISFLSGFIDKEDPFQGPTGTIIKSLDEGLKAIDDYHRLGYQQIKLYSAISPQWVKPMAAHAHALGMKVCGHIPAFMTAEQAIQAGYDEMTHMNFVFLNFMGDTVDTRTPARFRLVGLNAGKLDLHSKRVQDFIQLMKDKHVALDPSMNVWQGMFDEFKGDTSNFMKPVVKWLPESALTALAIQSPFGSEDQKQAYKASFAAMMEMLGILYRNGILLVAGTDGGEANACEPSFKNSYLQCSA
jgi:hypothetical protein